MTFDEQIQLDNAATDVAALFEHAAERQRAQAAWEAGPEDAAPPLGVEASAFAASHAFGRYVALQSLIDAPPELPDVPPPLADETAIAGLPDEQLIQYRQLAAIRPALP